MDFGRTFGSGRQRNPRTPEQQAEAQGPANRGGAAASHAAHPQLNKGAVERWASSGTRPPSPTSLFYQPLGQMPGQAPLEITTPRPETTREQIVLAWGPSGHAGKEGMQASPSAGISRGGMGFQEARRRPGWPTLQGLFGSAGPRAFPTDALISRESKPPKKEPSDVSPSLQQSGRDKSPRSMPAWGSGFESDLSTVLDLPRLDMQQSALEQYARNLGMSHGLAQTIPQPSPQPTHPTMDIHAHAALSLPRQWPTQNFQISLAATQASAPETSQTLRPAVEHREGGQHRRQGLWTEQGAPSSLQPWKERTAEPLLLQGISMSSSQSPIPSARDQLWRNRSGVQEQVAPFDFRLASGNRDESASKDQSLTSPNTVQSARGVSLVSSTRSWSEQTPNQVQQPNPGHRPNSIYAFPESPLISGQPLLKRQPLSAQLEEKKSADRLEVLSKDRINDFAKAFSSASADLSQSGRAGLEHRAPSPNWGLTLEPLGLAQSAERDFLGGSGVRIMESNPPLRDWKAAALKHAPKASGDALELTLEPSFRGGGYAPQQDTPHGQVQKEPTEKHRKRKLEKAMEQRPIVAPVVGAPENAEWEMQSRFSVEAGGLGRPLDMEAEDMEGQPLRKRQGAQLQDTGKPLESPAKRLSVSVQQNRAGDGRTSSDRGGQWEEGRGQDQGRPVGLLLSGKARERQEVGVEQPELKRADLQIQGQSKALPRELPPSTPEGDPLTVQGKGQKDPLKKSPAQDAQTGPERGPSGSFAWGKMLSELAKKGGNHVGSEMLRTGLFGSLMQGTQSGGLAHHHASSDPSEKLPLSSKSVERWVGRAPTLPVYFRSPPEERQTAPSGDHGKSRELTEVGKRLQEGNADEQLRRVDSEVGKEVVALDFRIPSKKLGKTLEDVETSRAEALSRRVKELEQQLGSKDRALAEAMKRIERLEARMGSRERHLQLVKDEEGGPLFEEAREGGPQQTRDEGGNTRAGRESGAHREEHREPCVQYQGAGPAAELGSGRDAELVRDLEEALAQSRILQSGVLGMQGVPGRRTEQEKARQEGVVEQGKGQEFLRDDMARTTGSMAPVPSMAYVPQEGPKKDLPATVKVENELDQRRKHGLEREAGSDLAAVGAARAVGVSAQRDDKDGRLGSAERQGVGSEGGVFSADPQNRPLQGLPAGLAQRSPELASDGTLDGAGDKGPSNDGAIFRGGSLGSSKGQATKAEDPRPPEPGHREEREKGLMAPKFVKGAEEDAESREVSRLKTQIEGLQAKVEMFSEMMEMWEAERTKYRARIVVKSNMDGISTPNSQPGASLVQEEEGKVDGSVAEAL